MLLCRFQNGKKAAKQQLNAMTKHERFKLLKANPLVFSEGFSLHLRGRHDLQGRVPGEDVSLGHGRFVARGWAARLHTSLYPCLLGYHTVVVSTVVSYRSPLSG